MRVRLLVDAAGQEASVDDENLSGDKGGRVGGEIDGCADDLLGLPEAAHGSAHEQFLAAWGVVEQIGIEGGAEDSGGDGVNQHPPAGPLDGKRAGERGDGGLAGGVGGDLTERNEGIERGDVDDASVLALKHVLAEDLAGAQGSGEIGIEDAQPFVFGEGERGRALDLSGTVDQDVGLAKVSEGLVEEILERGAVGDIGGNAESATAFCFDFDCGAFYLLGAAGGGYDVGSGFGEPERDGATDAGCASDHDGNFAFKIQGRLAHADFPSGCLPRKTGAIWRT